MNSTKRNVALLAACQALLFTNNSTLIAINGLAGLALAPYVGLATLPVTCWVLGGAIGTMPASLHMKRVGRQRGLTTGTFFGVIGALICATAIGLQSFWILCCGTLVWGVYNAYGQYYRFAAADVASGDFKATAISLVLAGGLVGGILGPTTSRWTIGLLAPKFLGAYVVLIGFAVATMVLLRFVRIPTPSAAEQAATGRPLRVIAAQPKFIVAVLAGAIGYGVMNFLMTSTPIAMQVCGHPYGDAAFVISSHIIAMFAPSFLSGPLIRRVGVLPVMFTGALLNFAAIGVALSGIAVPQFWWSLVLLGVGWNFLYIGGTTLLTETYRPEERARAQGTNEQAIFIMMVVSSLTSGLTVTTAGWERVNLFALPLVAVVAVALVWYALQQRRTA
jgi:MFS family permease